MEPNQSAAAVTAIRIVWEGRVQGVGFRAVVQSAATRHRVTGWVRNCPDGSVESCLFGVPAAIEQTLDDVSRARGIHIQSRRTSAAAIPAALPTTFEIRW